MKRLIGIVLFVSIMIIACHESNSILEPDTKVGLQKKVEEVKISTSESDSIDTPNSPGRPILPRI